MSSPWLLPLASAALALGGAAASAWLRHHQLPTAAALLALSPVAAVILWGVPWFRGLDELQRRIQVESFAAAAIVVATGGFALEYLRGAGVSVTADWTSALIATGLLYLGALALLGRRYA